MTTVKIKGGKPSKKLAEALEPHADDMFSRPTGTWLAVVEVSHVKRTETVKTDDEYDYVSREVEVRLSRLEIAGGVEDQEAAQALLHKLTGQRKSAGTLFDPAAVDAGDGPPW
ncbi:hypothetical protein NE857_31450 [Nocardiopsis exhalans]|uniref:Uncharacterized protein n=1 Tax=Nocardiopsis exhalans TaxID=163604 RepID=A0ABY5D6W1_9ACTN|nr:hypothetical protein [Nocardiopsis exhalans]USY19695.1 hypothetical protein NE857_31450 [Nocardiopsis exhalans]